MSGSFMNKPCSTGRDREIWKEKILFYTLEDVGDCDPPDGVENPIGSILYSIHSQNGVFEKLETVTMSVVGILTLNG
jgi:hypothetical protein